MPEDTVRIAVFIDWQNTYMTAREAFGWKTFPNEYGNYVRINSHESWPQETEEASRVHLFA